MDQVGIAEVRVAPDRFEEDARLQDATGVPQEVGEQLQLLVAQRQAAIVPHGLARILVQRDVGVGEEATASLGDGPTYVIAYSG